MGFKWEYEPEGYQLKGKPYLCDFLLRTSFGPVWAEVKPASEENDGEFSAGYLIERRQFCEETKWPLVLLIGPPDFGRIYDCMTHKGFLTLSMFVDYVTDSMAQLADLETHKIDFSLPAISVVLRGDYWPQTIDMDQSTGLNFLRDCSEDEDQTRKDFCGERRSENVQGKQFVAAVKESRAARFEHGEQG